MKTAELIEHFKATDMVSLFDIAWEVSNGLLVALSNHYAAAVDRTEAEVWALRMREVKGQRRRMPTDDRLAIIAYMAAWKEQTLALEPVAV